MPSLFTISNPVQQREYAQACFSDEDTNNNLSAICESRVAIGIAESCDANIHETHLFSSTGNEEFVRTFPIFNRNQHVKEILIYQNGTNLSSTDRVRLDSNSRILSISQTKSSVPVQYDLTYSITNAGLHYGNPCPGGGFNVPNSNIFRWGSGPLSYSLPTFTITFKTTMNSSSVTYSGSGNVVQENGTTVKIVHTNVGKGFEEVFWEKSRTICPKKFQCTDLTNQWQFKVVITLASVFFAVVVLTFLGGQIKQRLVARRLRRQQHLSRYPDRQRSQELPDYTEKNSRTLERRDGTVPIDNQLQA